MLGNSNTRRGYSVLGECRGGRGGGVPPGGGGGVERGPEDKGGRGERSCGGGLLTDLHGFQLAQQGAGGFWDVSGKVLMARLRTLAPLLQIAHLPLQTLLPATHTHPHTLTHSQQARAPSAHPTSYNMHILRHRQKEAEDGTQCTAGIPDLWLITQNSSFCCAVTDPSEETD